MRSTGHGRSPFWLPPCLSVCLSVLPLRLVGRNNTKAARTAHWLGHRDHASHPSQYPPPCLSFLVCDAGPPGTCPLRWD